MRDISSTLKIFAISTFINLILFMSAAFALKEVSTLHVTMMTVGIYVLATTSFFLLERQQRAVLVTLAPTLLFVMLPNFFPPEKVLTICICCSLISAILRSLLEEGLTSGVIYRLAFDEGYTTANATKSTSTQCKMEESYIRRKIGKHSRKQIRDYLRESGALTNQFSRVYKNIQVEKELI